MLFCALSAGPVGAITLEASTRLSTDGVVSLSWQPAGEPVVLERAASPDFADARVLYRGTDAASLRSGLENGAYHYRIAELHGDAAGPWSEPVQVTVRHHSQARAWTVFGVGAVVFIATLGLILGGMRREPRDE